MTPGDPWPNFDDLDAECFALLGLTPAQVDECSFRDLWVMLDAARRKRESEAREEWMRSLIVTQAIQNLLAKRPKPLDSLYKKAFPPIVPQMTLAEYRQRRDAAVNQREQRGDGS